MKERKTEMKKKEKKTRKIIWNMIRFAVQLRQRRVGCPRNGKRFNWFSQHLHVNYDAHSLYVRESYALKNIGSFSWRTMKLSSSADNILEMKKKRNTQKQIHFMKRPIKICNWVAACTNNNIFTHTNEKILERFVCAVKRERENTTTRKAAKNIPLMSFYVFLRILTFVLDVSCLC